MKLGLRPGGKVVGKRGLDDAAKRNGGQGGKGQGGARRRGGAAGLAGAGAGAVGGGGIARGKVRVGGRDAVTGRGRKKKAKLVLPKGWHMCRTLGEPVAGRTPNHNQ